MNTVVGAFALTIGLGGMAFAQADNQCQIGYKLSCPIFSDGCVCEKIVEHTSESDNDRLRDRVKPSIPPQQQTVDTVPAGEDPD